MDRKRKAYPSDPSDVSNKEWAFVAPYLTLITASKYSTSFSS
jgi:hypothetical protein